MAPLRVWTVVSGLAVIAGGASAQSLPPRGSGPASDVIAVFGERPLVDSAVSVLGRDGFRAADRSRSAIERARRSGRPFEHTRLALVVGVRYDTLAQGPIVVAELLNVETLNRLGLASARWPGYDAAWGTALAKVVRQVMQP